MVQNRSLKTDQDWLDLIQECRTSGLSDRDWCEANGIRRGRLYYQIRRLRKKACEIPPATFRTNSFTQQEVVPVTFEEGNEFPQECFPAPDTHNTERIAARVIMGSITVEINDGASGATIRNTLSALRALSC